MSAEILGNSKYFTVSQLREDGPVVHSAIHDLESFFWVLLYLCLTRSGPGGERRDELQPKPAPHPDTAHIPELPVQLVLQFDAESESTAMRMEMKKALTDQFLPAARKVLPPVFCLFDGGVGEDGVAYEPVLDDTLSGDNSHSVFVGVESSTTARPRASPSMRWRSFLRLSTSLLDAPACVLLVGPSNRATSIFILSSSMSLMT